MAAGDAPDASPPPYPPPLHAVSNDLVQDPSIIAILAGPHAHLQKGKVQVRPGQQHCPPQPQVHFAASWLPHSVGWAAAAAAVPAPHLCTNNVKPPHVPLYSNRHEVKDGDQCLQCLQALQASQEHLQHNKTDSRLAAQELRRPSRGRRLPPVYQAGVSAKLCHRSCASSSSPGC